MAKVQVLDGPPYFHITYAGLIKLVKMADLKSAGITALRIRLPCPAPFIWRFGEIGRRDRLRIYCLSDVWVGVPHPAP